MTKKYACFARISYLYPKYIAICVRKKAYQSTQFPCPHTQRAAQPQNPLYQLSLSIDWESLENDFAKLYSDKGRPAHPIRKMAGLLTIKNLYKLSDEDLIEKY